MLKSLLSLNGWRVEARDGEIGTVEGCYFDMGKWMVRYLVVRTGRWFNRSHIIISPASIIEPLDQYDACLPVDLTTGQIRQSPHIEFDLPLPRRYEADLVRYYGWPYYWDAGSGQFPFGIDMVLRQPSVLTADTDGRLINSLELTDYGIVARGEDAGTLEDLIVNDISWELRYAVIRLGAPRQDKRALLYTGWIDTVDTEVERIAVNISAGSIYDSPPYHPHQTITRSYENRLFDYYGLPKYWRKYEEAAPR